MRNFGFESGILRQGILIAGFRFEIYAPNFGLKFYLESAWLESLQAEFWLEISARDLQNFKIYEILRRGISA
ncbi:hypothetical protein [uncultured Campylobacter sp.]|uniref:hypothetical protein n=1 Tax=uncultured Campylobacter sp. TaxID=218934 RepID=UPI00262D189B|nr:hypothetical protein [uncultured Campylobacter sp.]